VDDGGIGVRFPAGADISFFPTPSRPARGLIVSYLMNIGVLSPGVKLPGLKADNSPISSAVVKNAWDYTATHRKS
jgi:hypothetical protein